MNILELSYPYHFRTLQDRLKYIKKNVLLNTLTLNPKVKVIEYEINEIDLKIIKLAYALHYKFDGISTLHRNRPFVSSNPIEKKQQKYFNRK